MEAKLLGELLAVIHGDGGHRQQEVGCQQAVAEAIEQIIKARVGYDLLLRAVKAQEDQSERGMIFLSKEELDNVTNLRKQALKLETKVDPT